MSELSLANVAAEVTAWRKTKQHRTSILPKEIADHIRELAKSHKTHHIVISDNNNYRETTIIIP